MRPSQASFERALARLALSLSLGVGIVASAGCGGQQKTEAGNPSQVSQGDFGARFDRSRCDDKGKQVVSLDANGDGKPDVIKLFLPGVQDGNQVQQLVCKQTDLDFDGKIDLIQYYGGAGDLFMDEYSMNYTGKFNGRTFFQDGKKIRGEKDMDFDGKPDYFEFYEGGRLVRVERDRNADGKVDEWQYYEAGRLDRIGYDTTGSGRVDKWERNPEGGPELPADSGAGGTAAAATPAVPSDPAGAAAAAAAAAAADAASRGAPKAPASAPAPAPAKK